MALLTQFDAQQARAQFEERVNSLEADIHRCFWPIPGGPGEAYFPPVLYALATIDYFSSYWAGWNDSARDPSKKQTSRLVEFMVKYLRYDRKASLVGVAIWRHKLMHTGEPRLLRARGGAERFVWQTGINLVDHMKLTPTGVSDEFVLRFDTLVVSCDLRAGIMGPAGYLHDLCTSNDLQQKFVACFNEMEGYMVDV